MKTLLLTLVVVTIVCLDLGHTRICYNQQSTTPPTTENCEPGKNVCYKMYFSDHRGTRSSRGCVVTCPTNNRYDRVVCCEKDKCNM
uniref:Short-chain three finger toxin isoform 5 n=1 Tax=Bungarus flaviceps TaxID=8614 RepID=D5J9P2_9SAUR|nr:short-chain three finger toxin isoform 5 [Bungarus flaviceps]